MKYIKTFEDINSEIYWKISTEKYYYEASLIKIGLPEDKMKYWTTIVPIEFESSDKKIYIFYEESLTKIWCWENLKYRLRGNEKYMGEVEITPEEIEIEKLKEKINKYNL